MAERKPLNIVIPGGGGYLGRVLSRYFIERGDRLTILSRQGGGESGGVRRILWDGKTLAAWADVIDGADVVINLAGRTVNCRYTARHKREIYESRLESTRVIGEAIARAKTPPRVWINSSSATVYRNALDRPQDEFTGEVGKDFSPDVVMKWEKTLDDAPTPRTRKVAMRSAMVFGPGKGGVYEAFATIVKLGLGGTLGSGKQMVAWVHDLDYCRAIEFLIEHEEMSGIVNLASPNPVPNREFMRVLRKALGKKVGLPAAKWMLEVGAFFLRTETELLLKSRWVVPGRLPEAGFTFRFPELKAAMREIVEREKSKGCQPPQL
jgi:uncharacterized protein (TIGR01777 family)